MERFSRDHQWIRVDGDVGTVGITDYAQSQLADVISIELPDTGRKAAAGDAVAVVESVKAASDVFSCRRGGRGQRRACRAAHPQKAKPGSSRLDSRTWPSSGR